MDASKFDNQQNAIDKTQLAQKNVQNTQSEIITDKKGKKAIKISNITKEQKELLMSVGIAGAGIAVGATAFSLFSFANPEDNDPNTTNESNSEANANATESVVIYTEAPFADTVNDSMSFNEAFNTAREQVDGGGGVFEWHGNIYNTYSKNEWEAMSAEDKNEYFNSIDSEVISSVENNENDTNEELVVENPEPDPTPIVDVDQTNSNNNPQTDFQPLIIESGDVTGDGITDYVVIDADENETPEVLIDTNSDGILDKLFVDVDFDNPNYNPEDAQYIKINIPLSELQNDTLIANEDTNTDFIDTSITSNDTSFNDDIDDFSDNDLNPNFDNDADMSDYV